MSQSEIYSINVNDIGWKSIEMLPGRFRKSYVHIDIYRYGGKHCEVLSKFRPSQVPPFSISYCIGFVIERSDFEPRSGHSVVL